MKVQIFLLFEFFLSTNLNNPAFGAKIEPELQKKIDSAPAGTTWNIIILFKEDPNLLPPPPYPNPNNEESHISAYNTMLKLKKHAEESQAKVISEIKSFVAARSSNNVRIQTTWCTSGVSLTSADRDLIYHLGDGKPEHANITRIVEDEDIGIGRGGKDGETLDLPPGQKSSDLLDKAWGIRKINAPAWWVKKYNGSGVIIGHIDDGVDINHPSLKYNWVGKKYGWYAPMDNTSVFPYQAKKGSHGTHTIGTVIGRGRVTSGNDSDPNYFGVGVAPGARWMSCGTCNGSKANSNSDSTTLSCLATTAVKCLEFLYCPNEKENCRYRPNVVSISMGCYQTKTQKCKRDRIMDPCIRALRSQSVIPVYAAGNTGEQGCGTISDPADNEEVIGVGNIDEGDFLATDSSKGPPEWRYNETQINDRAIFKPDFVAPGTQVISTVYTGTQARFVYGYKSGTSQAAPHVAGAIALLLSRTKDLSFQDVQLILRSSVINNTQLRSHSPGERCGEKEDTALTNHKFGYGRLRLPDLDSRILKLFPPKEPTRKMPPPPDFTADAVPRTVRLGMVGVVMMMVETAFQVNLNSILEI